MRAVASIAVALLAMTITTVARADTPDMTIGTGAAGGNYYSVGGALCRMVNRDARIRCLTHETSGSIDNLYALDLGDIDFAIIQADIQSMAHTGSERLASSPYADLRSVFTLYEEMLAVVVLANSGIEDLDDLRGRRVNGGKLNSGTKWTFEAVLDAHGIGIDDLAALKTGSVNKGAEQLCAGEIDALALISGHPSPSLTRLADTCDIAILPLDPVAVEAMIAGKAGYAAGEIPADIYRTISRPVTTIGTNATVVTLGSTDDALVTALMQSVFSDIEAFRQQQIMLGPDSPSRDDRNAPLHPAAQRFFDDATPGQ